MKKTNQKYRVVSADDLKEYSVELTKIQIGDDERDMTAEELAEFVKGKICVYDAESKEVDFTVRVELTESAV